MWNSYEEESDVNINDLWKTQKGRRNTRGQSQQKDQEKNIDHVSCKPQ